ncbi:phospholipid/cholesterol/gamma-HCH transport system substrate-binding protein [Myroides gitamensis]|uniref:MlaD family protein n=1 Tax=Myroides odoratus TaxID=256 RepID=UPI0021690F61|nr:MlaD family protein [Myroides odoratus]MCS4239742.1 phospholipid/cholesterol/gamma-HCH transport system substrate-binding protein [Myroides odoratus]MDH6601182.1 phospholipid/cholesterol/gamma-HCH transport system substrate-binding protein [Myroides gitamensis]
MKISREIKTAVLVLGAIALFIWGYSFLDGRNLFDNSTKYYVEYDNVEGLTTSSSVTINGLVVGKVSRININAQTGKLVVELMMTHPIDIAKSSVATIYSPGLLGGKGISIDPKFGDTDYAESGQYLKGDVQFDITEKLVGELEPLKVKLDEVLANANSMLVAINCVLDEQMQADLKTSVTELKGTLAGANKLMNGIEPQLKGTMTNLNVMSKNFVGLSQELSELDINGTFANLQSASANIDKLLADIENGNGSVGKLLKDEELYKNLTGASKELEQLMRDLKENPKRYVHFSLFGKKATPYQEKEEKKE